MFASCDKDGNDDDDGDDIGKKPTTWIVGMWRDKNPTTIKTACQIFYPDGSVIAIGITNRMDYNIGYFSSIDVSRGKYRLIDNKLEIFDYSWFEMTARSVSNSEQYAKDFAEVYKIVNTGSRSDVEKLFNPKHTLYAAYGFGEWKDGSNRDDELDIHDANYFETGWTHDTNWHLGRVKE